MESNWRWWAATMNPGSPRTTLFARYVAAGSQFALSNELQPLGYGLLWITADGGLTWTPSFVFGIPALHPHFPYGQAVFPD